MRDWLTLAGMLAIIACVLVFVIVRHDQNQDRCTRVGGTLMSNYPYAERCMIGTGLKEVHPQ